jgi:hypothetical protein
LIASGSCAAIAWAPTSSCFGASPAAAQVRPFQYVAPVHASRRLTWVPRTPPLLAQPASTTAIASFISTNGSRSGRSISRQVTLKSPPRRQCNPVKACM